MKTKISEKHRIIWADGGCVGFDCGKEDGGTLWEGKEPQACAVCGVELTLKWIVEIREAAP